MISASSRFAPALTSSGSARNARSTRKNMKFTNWRCNAGCCSRAGFVSGAVVVVMETDINSCNLD
jgi:hypothetical protein